MTHRQAQELGRQVRKGEHGSLVVYADRFKNTEADESGNDIEREIPFMKGYTVFNVEQIERLPEMYYTKPAPAAEKMQLIAEAEVFFNATGATFRHGGSMAYYAPGPDVIQLPYPEAFHWLEVLKNDRRAIFTAAAHAQRAVDYLHALQGERAAAA
jgi:antirestriction protein ArdC